MMILVKVLWSIYMFFLSSVSNIFGPVIASPSGIVLSSFKTANVFCDSGGLSFGFSLIVSSIRRIVIPVCFDMVLSCFKTIAFAFCEYDLAFAIWPVESFCVSIFYLFFSDRPVVPILIYSWYISIESQKSNV